MRLYIVLHHGLFILFIVSDLPLKHHISPISNHNLDMNKEIIITLLVLGGVVWGESCGSCGMECESACGTRHFRTCCFNYLKKRSQLPETFPVAMDPSLRLELWLAKSKIPPFQRLNFDAPQDHHRVE